MSIITDLYNQFFRSAWEVTEFSREKADHAASAFWSLCIGAGLEFDIGDFAAIEQCCKGDSWGPRFYSPGEGHYALAVHENHIQFCRAYEQMTGRIPFIGKNLDYYSAPSGAYTLHQTQARSQGRLVLGCRFIWQGERVTVTSFKDGVHSLVACSYQDKNQEDRYERTKVKKRFTITHEQWQAAQKQEKKP